MFGRGNRGGTGSLYYDEPGDQRLPFDKDPIIARASSFTVSSNPAEVKRVVLTWADALGWRQQESALTFPPGRLALSSIQLDVALDEEEGQTTASFTACLPRVETGKGDPTGAAPFLERVAAAFADGVREQLHFQETGWGSSYPAIGGGESRLAVLERWRRRLLWPLMVLGPIVFMIVLPARGLSHYEPVAWAAGLWLAAVFATHLYLRWWILGTKSKWLLAMALLFWIGVAIAAGFAVGG